MRLLVLGGTSFVGRHLVLAARAAGTEVTLFNRGRTNPGLFPDVEQIHGDRDGGLDALAGRHWDAVVDVNGYVPRLVALTARTVQTAHYTFVSSVSVYGDTGETGPTESTPVAALERDTEEVTGETYGPLKAQCEDTVRAVFGDRALVVRPGLIVGPHDPTERFVRWIRRAGDAGPLLAPGDPGRQVQFIDARDLADWVIRMVVAQAGGTFNATGPRPATTMGALLRTCVEVAAAGAEPVWVPEAFLLEQGVAPWADMPLWLPAARNGTLLADNSRAVGAGLTFRSIEDSVRATRAWDRARDRRGPAGLSTEREAAVLAAWSTTT